MLSVASIGLCAPTPGLSDNAVAAKLATMRTRRARGSRVSRGSRGMPAAAATAAVSTQTVPPSPGGSDGVVWQVPPALRVAGAPCFAPHSYGRQLSLDELFPSTGLGAAFDTDASLRESIRRAMRADLFVPPAEWSRMQLSAATALSSSLMVGWRAAATHPPAACAESSCPALTRAFASAGVSLRGEDFLGALGSLCGTSPHGSLIDIANNGRRHVAHSWHQDAAEAAATSATVMLGFPARNGYVGAGVFSHCVKLSHPIAARAADAAPGEVLEFERLAEGGAEGGGGGRGGTVGEVSIPEGCVWRPVYARGQEVLVYNDAAHLHSAPDEQLREAVWRFM